MPISDKPRLNHPLNAKKPTPITPNPWVTGGPPGGKDAVLVFRTSALSPVNSSTDVSESGTATGASDTSDEITALAAASSSTGNSIKDPTGTPSDKLANHSKVLASLPKNFNVQRKSTSISSTTTNWD